MRAAPGSDDEPPAGGTVSNDNPSEGESLEDGTRKANSNLQRLIEAIGGLLSASGDLLGRLQQILGGAQPAANGSSGSGESDTPPPADSREG